MSGRAYKVTRRFEGSPLELFAVDITKKTKDQIRLAERHHAFGHRLLFDPNEIDTAPWDAVSRAREELLHKKGALLHEIEGVDADLKAVSELIRPVKESAAKPSTNHPLFGGEPDDEDFEDEMSKE